jgi:heme exporter protein D
MAFESWSDFWEMGKHGLYVWSTYGISMLLLVGLLVTTRLHRRQLCKQLKKRIQREQSR